MSNLTCFDVIILLWLGLFSDSLFAVPVFIKELLTLVDEDEDKLFAVLLLLPTVLLLSIVYSKLTDVADAGKFVNSV